MPSDPLHSSINMLMSQMHQLKEKVMSTIKTSLRLVFLSFALVTLTSCSTASKTKAPDQDTLNPTPLPSMTAPTTQAQESFVQGSNPAYDNGSTGGEPITSPIVPSTSQKVSYQPLERYNQMAGGDFASSVMVFSSVPVNSEETENVATRIAEKIKTLSNSGLQAVIVIEPISASAGKLSFTDIALGKYNNDFVALVAALKAKGVTNANIGNWIIWPEPNLPDKYWNKPGFVSSTYGDMFNNFAGPLKAAFPNAQTTILMDTKSYEPDDIDYARGTATSWSPYLIRVNKNLVTTIGIQGFTWYSKDGRDELTDPKQYLPTNLVVEAANQLGVKNVLVNTGQAKAYKSTSGSIVSIPDAKRRGINNQVAAQILSIHNQGFGVTANFFVEDKIDTEGVNFSYPDSDGAMFRLLVNDLNYAKVKIGMFTP
jgi:hypothetical protein